jgi:hypothetical protein
MVELIGEEKYVQVLSHGAKLLFATGAGTELQSESNCSMDF